MIGRWAKRRGPRVVTAALCLGLVAFVGFAVYQAFALRLHYYDTFDYLNDARRLLGDRAAVYYRVHAPLVPLLSSPIAWFARMGPAAGAQHWVLPHLLGLSFALLMCAATFAWIRRTQGLAYALLGVLLVVGNRLFVRYAPFMLGDVLAGAWVALAFYWWDRACRDGGAKHIYAAAGAGLCIALGMLTKYSLLVLAVPLVVGEVLRLVARRRVDRQRTAALVLAGAVATAAFVVVFGGTFWRVDGTASVDTFMDVLNESTRRVHAMEGEQSTDYLTMLPQVLSPVFLLLAAIGWMQGLLSHRHRDLPALLWVPFFVGLLSLRVAHNEARYLWPVLPALGYFAARGARAGVEWLAGMHRALPWVLGPAALAAALWPGADQARRDTAAVFYEPTQPRTAAFVLEHAGAHGQVFWSGHFVALVPRGGFDIEGDEFFNFFHFGTEAIRYFTGRRVEGVPGRPDPATYLRRRGGARGVLIQGPPRFVHAIDVRHGRDPPEHFRLHARVGSREYELVLPTR